MSCSVVMRHFTAIALALTLTGPLPPRWSDPSDLSERTAGFQQQALSARLVNGFHPFFSPLGAALASMAANLQNNLWIRLAEARHALFRQNWVDIRWEKVSRRLNPHQKTFIYTNTLPHDDPKQQTHRIEIKVIGGQKTAVLSIVAFPDGRLQFSDGLTPPLEGIAEQVFSMTPTSSAGPLFWAVHPWTTKGPPAFMVSQDGDSNVTITTFDAPPILVEYVREVKQPRRIPLRIQDLTFNPASPEDVHRLKRIPLYTTMVLTVVKHSDATPAFDIETFWIERQPSNNQIFVTWNGQAIDITRKPWTFYESDDNPYEGLIRLSSHMIDNVGFIVVDKLSSKVKRVEATHETLDTSTHRSSLRLLQTSL